jgi:large repetitive protein
VISHTDPTHGTVIDEGSGYFTYTPNQGYVGTDSFSYTISDGIATDTATVSFNVTNTDPDAVDDGIYDLHANTSLYVYVLGNDSDADGDVLSVISHTDPTHGTVIDEGSGYFTYTPNQGYVGVDSFSYTISDGIATDTATVSFNVTNTDPDAVDDGIYDLHANTGLYVYVLGNDSDADGDVLSVISHTDPTHGTVIDEGSGYFTYTPNQGYVGVDSFSYTISDGIATDTATVSFNVTNTDAGCGG